MILTPLSKTTAVSLLLGAATIAALLFAFSLAEPVLPSQVREAIYPVVRIVFDMLGWVLPVLVLALPMGLAAAHRSHREQAS